jgi:O-antigen ligase
MISFIIFPLGLEIKQIKQELFNPNLDLSASSLEIRSSQWQETALMLKDNFIFGSGLNAYQKTMEKYHQNDWLEIYLYPHNIFLNFWVELGLFGLLVFLSLMVFIFISLRNLFKTKNILAWPLSLTWLIWFIHGLVDVPYFKNDLSILFFIFLVLTISASLKNLELSTYKN